MAFIVPNIEIFIFATLVTCMFPSDCDGFVCRHVGNRTTYYDRQCSLPGGENIGCNAGGQGRNCRYCGFDKFAECPMATTDSGRGNSLATSQPVTSTPFLQRSPLFGLAYSPFRNSSSCSSVTESMIAADLDRVASIADAVRIYSLECDFGPMIIKKTRERDLNLVLGVRVTSDESHFRHDRRALDQILLDRTDLDHVIAVSVGSDAIARYHFSETMVIEKLREIRGLLHSYGYQIPVTTSDIYEKYNSYRMIEAVDMLLPNLRVFSSEVSAELSPRLVFDMIKRLRSWSVASSKEFIVGETGWPTGGDLSASPQSAWSYLKKFRCQAREAGVKYFYFEAFDSAWKQLGANDEDSHWGIGTADRHWKPGFLEALRC